jgi:Carboxylesterase.
MVMFFFVPTVDMVPGNNDVFLPAHPYDLIITGKFQHVPQIIGANSVEGLISLHGMCCNVDEYGNFSFTPLYLYTCIFQHHLSLRFDLNLYIFLQVLLFSNKSAGFFEECIHTFLKQILPHF